MPEDAGEESRPGQRALAHRRPEGREVMADYGIEAGLAALAEPPNPLGIQPLLE